MPRIKLIPLKRYQSQIELTVRITDLNYGGHLGNDSLLSLVHEARARFLAEHGFSEMNCGGASIILADTVIAYRSEAFAGDILLIDIAAGEPTHSGFRLYFRLTRPADGAVIALVENGVVCFNYRTRKVCQLPDAVRSICKT